LFIGPRCSGKSTAALLGKLLGYEVLSDEVLLFKRGVPGQVRAFPHSIKIRAGTHLVLSRIMSDKYAEFAAYYPEDFHITPNVRSAQVSEIYFLQHIDKHPVMYIYDCLLAKERSMVCADFCEVVNLLSTCRTESLDINLTNGKYIWKSFDLLMDILK
jgi:hypothetical protein